MGKLTRTQIISQGILLAGKSSVDTAFASLVVVSWNAWLRSTYKAWLWPFLQRQASVTLATGTQTLQIGGGVGGISQDIDDLFDPIYVSTSDYQYIGSARVRQLRGGSSAFETSISDQTKNRGAPTEFKAREFGGTADGQWALLPYPIPNKNYTLTIDYKFLPADTTSDSDVPDYRNDRTMIQGAKVLALEHMKAEDYQQELQVLATMVTQDFAKDASKTGTNDSQGLDPNYFK